LAEAERVAQQVIAAARAGRFLAPREAGMENTQYLRSLRRGLSVDPNLEGAVVHLEGLVGPQDTLILLDRALGPG
jgi:hypothetical protein